MNFPLQLSFKIVALANQISVTDANGQLIFYVKQKLFKLKEQVGVFADREQNQRLYQMGADRIIDFSPRFTFTDQHGQVVGAIKRQGMKSLWRARYDLFDGETNELYITENNPWIKVMDRVLGEIPFLGLLTGYLFHPVYDVCRTLDNMPVFRITKSKSFFEGKFVMEKLQDVAPDQELRVVLGTLMVALMERARG